jgi:hypothetical protein
MSNSQSKILFEWIFPMLIFFVGIWYFCIRILGYNFEFIPGDLGDSRFINYLLEHNYLWISGKVDSFWDAGFMFPNTNTIAISDNMLGTAPIYSIFRLFGFEQETAYQLWWISICSLNYWVTFFIAKKWSGRTDLAIVAAFVFAFSIYNIYQLNYMQMTIRFMVPVAIYFGYRLVKTGLVKYLLYVSLAIVFQMYSVLYTGFFLLYFTAGFILIYTLISKQFSSIKLIFSKQNLLKTLSVTLGSFALLLILMLPYLKTSSELGLRLFDEVKWNLPVWNAYFLPHKASAIWGWMHDTFLPEETKWWLQSVFIGVIPLLVVLSTPFMLGYWKIKKIKPSAITLTLTIIVLGITLLFIRLENGMTLYMFIFKLPGLNSMRVLNRFMHVQLFFVLILLLLWLKDKPKSWTLVLIVLLFIDNSFNTNEILRKPKQEIVDRRESIAKEVNQLKKTNHKAFAIINPNEKNYITHIDAMTASFYVGLPTINGYTSTCPNDFGNFFDNVNREGFNFWIEKNGIKPEDVLILEK